MDRRNFLKQAGLAAGVAAAQPLESLHAAAPSVAYAIAIDPQDHVASKAAPAWAIDTLLKSFAQQGISANMYPRLIDTPYTAHRIFIAHSENATAREILKAANAKIPSAPESLGLVAGGTAARPLFLVTGSDERGLVYSILEAADRVKYGSPLEFKTPVVEQPANQIRSCARCFVSDIEDKSWYYDEALWQEYLTTLATHRFNRFNLTFGIGYNGARNIPDSYFYFAYPFLLPVQGYDVKAVGLPDAERDRNLEMLKFIGEQTVRRGMQFNLALWSHAYEWPNPDTNYKISGLTPETHAAYCRDGLAAVLNACPQITGLSFRVHTESGVPDGRYDFWETVLSAIPKAGRKIDIDVHAKGTDERHIAIARSTGMPVSMAPKFWAEHMGMPYHQAAIRELEFEPVANAAPNNITGRRNFLRYGYGDYLKDTRQYGIIHRVWPGTQRHLLWGDPAMAAGYGRAFSFSGSLGVELFEPLSFKGRMGSGIAGGRIAYTDKSLVPQWDWQKYEYQYRVWGRYTYNPDTDADGHRRYLRQQFAAASDPIESALSNASRILPVVTTTHGVSGSNNVYWPEMYSNMPIVDAKRTVEYTDTPAPKVFGNVSAFDPQLFCTINECAASLVTGDVTAKYTPLDVAQWLEDMSAAATKNLAEAVSRAPQKDSPEFRRVNVDAAMQAGIGRFFAYKFRSGVLWGLYQNTGDRGALAESLKAYRTAREAWASVGEIAKPVYAADITYGKNGNMRGHWSDRLTAIDADIADMEARINDSTPLPPATAVSADVSRKAIAYALARPNRLVADARHTAAAHFDPGKPLEVSVAFNSNGNRTVKLFYRQADQSQRWQSIDMHEDNNQFHVAIPGDYTQSPFPLQYYFQVTQSGASTIFPGFASDLSNQPYILIRRTTDGG